MTDIRVEVDAVTEHERDGIERAFRRAGLNVRVEPPSTEVRGATPPTWIIEIYVAHLVLKPFFNGFLTRTGELAAEDSYRAFKRFVRELFDTVGERDGFIRIIDADDRLIEIPRTIPDEALDALLEVDWSKHLPGDLFWSEKRQEWLRVENDPSAF
jgi:hypothetical protein